MGERSVLRRLDCTDKCNDKHKTNGVSHARIIDRDADLNLIKSKKGKPFIRLRSQGGRACASTQGITGRKPTSPSPCAKATATAKKAKPMASASLSVAEAAGWADLMMMALPTSARLNIYKNHIAAKSVMGKPIAFAHGLNVHFAASSQRRSTVRRFVMMHPRAPPHRARRIPEGGACRCLSVHHDCIGQRP